jgi:receptor-type tyrosine-protein phosphatase Q
MEVGMQSQLDVYERNSSHSEILINGLKPSTEYECILAAENEVGIGPFSESLKMTTPSDGKIEFWAKFIIFLTTMCIHEADFNFILPAAPRAPPQNVRVIAINSTAIEITWLPPPENTLHGVIRFYTVNGTEIVTMDSTYYQEVNTTKAVFSGLHPNYMYSFIVAAVANDPGPLSEAVSNYTKEDGKT